MPDSDERDELSPEQADEPHPNAESFEHLIELLWSRRVQQGLPAARTTRQRSLHPTVITVRSTADQRLTFHISGQEAENVHPTRNWQIDFGVLNLQMNDLGRYLAEYYRTGNNAGRASWERVATGIGTHLYRGLHDTQRGLVWRIAAERGRAALPEDLTLVFEGPREYLGVPYELLHTGRAPLAVQHPLCRTVATSAKRSGAALDTLVSDLRQARQPLRCLLIGSGLRQRASDLELDTVEQAIRQGAAQYGALVEIERIPGRAAGLETVAGQLRRCPYHVIHYAGEIYTDRVTPENCGLWLAGAGAAKLGGEVLTSDELVGVLAGGSAALVVLSGCLGPQTWEKFALREPDYLDLMTAPVRAGAESVLGFRWYVPDEARRLFAQRFYERLFQDPIVPECAVFFARRSAQRSGDAETWASALLVVQHPYR